MSLTAQSMPELQEFPRRVFDVLKRHTSFPWPVMQAQCRRHDLDPHTFDAADLPGLLDDIEQAVARFTSPDNGRAARMRLEQLLA